jgi:hypothetical protein
VSRPEAGGELRSKPASFLVVLALFPLLAEAAPPSPSADVRLRDQRVLSVRADRPGRTAPERARAASLALAQAHEEDPAADAVPEVRGDAATIRVGRVPVLDLGPEDVQAAGAPGMGELAQSTASEVNHALRAERRRARVAEGVFDVSLLVLSALVTWLLLRKIAELDRRIEGSVRERRRRVPALRVSGIEVVSPEGVAGALAVGIRAGRWLLQLVLAYAWLVFALSLFPATRGAGLQLGGVVLGPAAGTLSRLGAAIPALVAAAIALVALGVLLRAVRLFFHSVAAGDTHLRWLSPDLAEPTGQLVRIAIVVLAAIFAAPILTGSDQGTLAHLGTAALLAVALAAGPALAGVAAGLPRLVGRTYRTGHVAEIGRATGIVRSVGLLGVELEDPSGRRVLVPHLSTLWTPTWLPGLAPAARFEVAVDPAHDQAVVREILLRTGGPGTAADLVRLDGAAAVYRVAGPGVDLAVRVASALRAEGVRLGRLPPGAAGAP